MSLTFLSLPGEVRNKIYRLALVHHSVSQARYGPIRAPGGAVYYHGPICHNRMRHSRYEAYFEPIFHLSILRACRIIYQEALTILYGENVIWFDCVPLGAPLLTLGLTHSKLGYKGIRWQRKLLKYWNSLLRNLMPKPLHIPLRFYVNDGFRKIQHVGLVLQYNRDAWDDFGGRPDSSRSLSAALRNFAQSGYLLKTAKLDLRFGEYCKPDAFAIDSVLMKAALGLVVEEEILITATGFVEDSVGVFAQALAKKKNWALEANTVHHLRPAIKRYDIDDTDSVVADQADSNEDINQDDQNDDDGDGQNEQNDDDAVDQNEQDDDNESEGFNIIVNIDGEDEYAEWVESVYSWRLRPYA